MPAARPLRLLIMMMLIAASTLGSGRLSFADFADGLAAYDAGDLQAAYEAWLPLAEQGDVQAQVALAGLLETGGAGFAQDLTAAAEWYQRAADEGDPIAQMNLGEFYALGKGVARDPSRALALFSLAAEQGQQWAAGQRDRLASTMSAQEIDLAKTLMNRLRRAD